MNVWLRCYNPMNWLVPAAGFALSCLGAYWHNYYLVAFGWAVMLQIWIFPEPEDYDNFFGRVITGYRLFIYEPKTIWTALERIFGLSIIASLYSSLWLQNQQLIVINAMALFCGLLLWTRALERRCLSHPDYSPKTHQWIGLKKIR